MQKESNELPKFGWWDMAKAFYFLLDTKRKKYFTYTSILILVLFYDLVPVFVIGKIVDFFTNYKNGDSLNQFYYYIIFITLTWGAVSLIRLTIKKRISNIQSDVSYFTRVRGFERLLDFSIAWHDKENTGNKVQKIQNGTENLRQIQVLLSNELFGQATGIIGVLVSFLLIKPLLVVYCLIYIGIFITIQLSFYRRMVEMNNTNNILQEKAGGAYYEGLGNILTIKTLGVKDDFKKNIVTKEALTRDHSIKRVTMINNKWKYFQIVNAVSIGGVILLAGSSFVAGTISLGAIFIIYNYFQRLNGSVSQSTDSIEKLINAKVGIARMMPIFWDTTNSAQGHLNFPSNWDSIQLHEANFNYIKNTENTTIEEKSETGLKNISLIIEKNKKIGVVGKSGSGKSTFAKILLGLYKFNDGDFKIGNSNFYDIKHDEITKEIALVLQDSEMFNLSLKENITLMRTFDEKLFNKAIAIAQLTDVVEKLPNGVETLIGEKGYRLSGGERQRIGIARAIYKDTQILVLDEATSSLDSRTEELIQNAFEESLKNKTVISIAHRISTLKNVDKIVVFENGEIVEEGTFAGLSHNQQSKFYEVYKQQKTSNSTESL